MILAEFLFRESVVLLLVVLALSLGFTSGVFVTAWDKQAASGLWETEIAQIETSIPSTMPVSSVTPIVLPRVVYNLTAARKEVREEPELPQRAAIESVFALKNRVYFIQGQKFVVSSDCENFPKCNGECCGGLAWIGESDKQVWILNNNYSRAWYYSACAHERLHHRFPQANESEVEDLRLREVVLNVSDLVCKEFLEAASVKYLAGQKIANFIPETEKKDNATVFNLEVETKK